MKNLKKIKLIIKNLSYVVKRKDLILKSLYRDVSVNNWLVLFVVELIKKRKFKIVSHKSFIEI